MKNLFMIVLSATLLINCAFAQHAVVQQFKANALLSDNPITSVKNYDMMIACRAYDNIAHKLIFNVLLLKAGHWQRMTGSMPAQSVPLSVDEPTLKPLETTDAQGDAIITQLAAAHLFTVPDDNSGLPKCNETEETKNGNRDVVDHSIEDGPEYRIWIATPKKVRYLYYYAPEYFAQFCTDNKEREDVVKIVHLFREW